MPIKWVGAQSGVPHHFVKIKNVNKCLPPRPRSYDIVRRKPHMKAINSDKWPNI